MIFLSQFGMCTCLLVLVISPPSSGKPLIKYIMTRTNRNIDDTHIDVIKTIAKGSIANDISDIFRLTSDVTCGTSGVQIRKYTNTSGQDEIVSFRFFCDVMSKAVSAAVLGILPGDVSVSTAGTEIYDRPVVLVAGGNDDSVVLNWHGVLPAGYKLCLVLTSAAALKNHYENLSLSGDGTFNPTSIQHVCHVVVYNR